MENTECLIVYTPFIDFKVGVSLDYGVPLCFVLLLALQTLCARFQAKDNIRNAHARTILTYHSLAPKP